MALGKYQIEATIKLEDKLSKAFDKMTADTEMAAKKLRRTIDKLDKVSVGQKLVSTLKKSNVQAMILKTTMKGIARTAGLIKGIGVRGAGLATVGGVAAGAAAWKTLQYADETAAHRRLQLVNNRGDIGKTDKAFKEQDHLARFSAFGRQDIYKQTTKLMPIFHENTIAAVRAATNIAAQFKIPLEMASVRAKQVVTGEFGEAKDIGIMKEEIAKYNAKGQKGYMISYFNKRLDKDVRRWIIDMRQQMSDADKIKGRASIVSVLSDIGYGGNEAAARTLGASTSNFTDAIMNALSNGFIGKSAGDDKGSGLQVIISKIKEFTQAINNGSLSQIAKDIGVLVREWITGISVKDVMTNIKVTFDKFVEIWSKISPKLLPLFDNIYNIIATLVRVFEPILIPALQTVASSLLLISEGLLSILGKFGISVKTDKQKKIEKLSQSLAGVQGQTEKTEYKGQKVIPFKRPQKDAPVINTTVNVAKDGATEVITETDSERRVVKQMGQNR